jgi:urea transport system substrate-binding protein
VPAVDWLLSKEGGAKKKFFLVGSNYVYPRTVNFLIGTYLKSKKIELVGEEYTKLGHTEYALLANAIAKAAPDVIFNSLNGDSNINFYKELAANGLTPDKCPVVATSIDEDDLTGLPVEAVTGHLATHSHFQSLNLKANQDFVARFKKKYGKDRILTANIEAAYLQVFLWKAAVEKAKSTDVAKVQEAIRGLEFDAPEGKIKVDEKNNHLWRKFRLGKITKNRQFEVIFESKEWIKPDPDRSPLKFGN